LRRFLRGYPFIAPAILFLLAVNIYPLINTIEMSFLRLGREGWLCVGLQNYISMLKDHWFWNSLKLISIVAVVLTFLHISIGMVLALLLNERWFSLTLRSIMRGVLILSWLFSTAAAALMWSLLYHPFGLLNYFAQTLFNLSSPVQFLGNPKVALWSIIAVSAWLYYPYYMLMILGALQSVPLELYEAATVDGARAWHRFRYVTLPHLRPVLIVTTTIDIIRTFSHVDLFKMLTRGGPLRSTEVVAYYIYKSALLDGNLGYGAAMSTFVLLCLAIFMVVYMRLLSRGGGAGETSF
jgi:multiple sugar transport system permease protein